MNPVLILIIILILSNQGGSVAHKKSPLVGKLTLPPLGPAYVDTFKMELLLDKLHSMTNTLEKVNHLNQMRNVPLTKSNSVDRIQESLDAVRGLLSDQKPSRQLDTISNTLSSVKKIGDMEGMMSTIGPILSMLNSQNEK